MTIGPVDRRGLSETIAFASAMVGLLVLALAQLFKLGAIDPMVLSSFLASVTILLARGTKGAMDRSATADQQAPQQQAQNVPPITDGK